MADSEGPIMPATVVSAQLRPPTLIIVGEVVRLREKLNWYGKAAASIPA